MVVILTKTPIVLMVVGIPGIRGENPLNDLFPHRKFMRYKKFFCVLVDGSHGVRVTYHGWLTNLSRATYPPETK